MCESPYGNKQARKIYVNYHSI